MDSPSKDCELFTPGMRGKEQYSPPFIAVLTNTTDALSASTKMPISGWTFVVSMLATFTAVLEAQVPMWGACPTIETVPDFDINRYMGKWFEVEAYFHFFELGLSCITSEYTIRPSVGHGAHPAIAVQNVGYSWMHASEIASEGEAYIPDPTRAPAKLKVNFPNVTGTAGVADADYWILDTDYENYAVVWSCTAMEVFGASFMNAQTLWILGRTPKLPEILLDVLKTRLKEKGINPTGLVRQDHDSCPGRSNSKPPHLRRDSAAVRKLPDPADLSSSIKTTIMRQFSANVHNVRKSLMPRRRSTYGGFQSELINVADIPHDRPQRDRRSNWTTI
ncbi:putative Apolipoprotein D [Hypsibius exemplaris]|uniref:Apolipoprotein D n=1 Tax=Hypsibius exemplaris TaxID=2072580 RepID=A0A1W0X534_HYPEX|nr:putative Apolipoprotein D [Hypsibius exemplaris]